MSYVIYGRRDQLGRVASRATVAAALAEACRMERDGFCGVELAHGFQDPVPARLFQSQHRDLAATACETCGEAGCALRRPPAA